MARCCDPRENTAGTINRQFKLGGMKHPGAVEEVIDTLTDIDGVVNADISGSQSLSVEFDPGKVSEEHLISTLNSLGHSILQD